MVQQRDSDDTIDRAIHADLSKLSERSGLKDPRFGTTQLIHMGELPGARQQQVLLYKKLILGNIDSVEPVQCREALYVKLNLRDGYPDNSCGERLGILGRSWGRKVPEFGKEKGRSKRTEDEARDAQRYLATLIRKEIAERNERKAWEDLLGEPVGELPVAGSFSSAEAENQLQERKPVPPDISVDNIETTLLLDDDGKPIGRESSFTVQALRTLTDSITAVLEFNNGEFRIDNTVNCAVLNLRDYFALAEFDFPEGQDVVNLFESMLAEVSDQEDEDLRRLKMLTRNLEESLGNILKHQQGLRQAQEEMRTITTKLGVSDVLAIDVPPQEAGESLTFSYDTSYANPLDKDTIISYGAPLRPPTCTLGYSHDARGFIIVASRPLPRVTLRIRANQPLKVVPHLRSPGTPQFWSMPVIPFGVINILKRASDGSYEHTFHDLAPGSSAVLMWFVE